MLPPPPVPAKKDVAYPAWATSIGAKLKEDAGGKYYEMAYEVTDKVYVYPNFRVEQTRAFVKRPYGYKGKRESRASNAISAATKTKKAVVEEPQVRKVETEEW